MSKKHKRRFGWTCPLCGIAYAPWVMSCECEKDEAPCSCQCGTSTETADQPPVPPSRDADFYDKWAGSDSGTEPYNPYRKQVFPATPDRPCTTFIQACPLVDPDKEEWQWLYVQREECAAPCLAEYKADPRYEEVKSLQEKLQSVSKENAILQGQLRRWRESYVALNEDAPSPLPTSLLGLYEMSTGYYESDDIRDRILDGRTSVEDAEGLLSHFNPLCLTYQKLSGWIEKARCLQAETQEEDPSSPLPQDVEASVEAEDDSNLRAKLQSLSYDNAALLDQLMRWREVCQQACGGSEELCAAVDDRCVQVHDAAVQEARQQANSRSTPLPDYTESVDVADSPPRTLRFEVKNMQTLEAEILQHQQDAAIAELQDASDKVFLVPNFAEALRTLGLQQNPMTLTSQWKQWITAHGAPYVPDEDATTNPATQDHVIQAAQPEVPSRKTNYE